MKHQLKTLALACSAAFGGTLAHAQAEQEAEAKAPAPVKPEAAPMAARPAWPMFMLPARVTAMQQGVVSGIVTGLNYANGVVWLSTDGRQVALRATPAQMLTLQPGQVVSVPYANFIGVPWVMSAPGLPAGGFSQQGTFTGVVTGLNKSTGLVAIHGQLFLAHPQMIQGLLPGQFVSLSYAQIQDVPWVQSIAPAPSVPLQ